jgi:hypothetical protein
MVAGILLRGLVKRIDSLIAVAAIVLITVGVHRIYPPAGWIAAGVLLAADVYIPRIRGQRHGRTV